LIDRKGDNQERDDRTGNREGDSIAWWWRVVSPVAIWSWEYIGRRLGT
jgi:hypothetical protein